MLALCIRAVWHQTVVDVSPDLRRNGCLRLEAFAWTYPVRGARSSEPF